MFSVHDDSNLHPNLKKCDYKLQEVSVVSNEYYKGVNIIVSHLESMSHALMCERRLRIFLECKG